MTKMADPEPHGKAAEETAAVLLGNGRAERRVHDPRLRHTIKLVSACIGDPSEPYIYVLRDGAIRLGAGKRASKRVADADRRRMLGLF
jgi:hypothetical protein